MAALFKLYLFIWTMLSYNWVDRNLYSVAYNNNADNIDSDELEDYIYSRWQKKVLKPILRKTSGIAIKRDHTFLKNIPNKKHTQWVLLKNEMNRHNGDEDDDSYLVDSSSDNDEDDMSSEEEEEEAESVYDNSDKNGENHHYHGDDVGSYYLLRAKIYKDIDKLTHKCSLPLNSKCLSALFYHVFKNLIKLIKKSKNKLKSKEQTAVLHLNPYPLKSLHQLLEDIFLKKYAFLSQSKKEHPSEIKIQNSSSKEDRNKLLEKLITLTHEDNISKNVPTMSIVTSLKKPEEEKETAISSAGVSPNKPESLATKLTQNEWEKIKHDSSPKYPEIKISFNEDKLNLEENTYLSLESFYKIIGILNDLNINFTYSLDKKAIFINSQSLLAARVYGNFLNIKNFGWQKRKPLKVRIDFNKNDNNSAIILKRYIGETSKDTKTKSDSSEIKIEFLQSEKNKTAGPKIIKFLKKTSSFTPQPITSSHSPVDLNININLNDKHLNNSLTAGRKNHINISHPVYTDSHKTYVHILSTVTSATPLGEWTVWYKWSPCSTSCGIGHRKRHRLCLPSGFYCPGKHSEKASCLKRHCKPAKTPPHGHFTSWNKWSECSVSCGIGLRSRHRLCLPERSHCTGNITEKVSCMKISCDVGKI